MKKTSNDKIKYLNYTTKNDVEFTKKNIKAIYKMKVLMRLIANEIKESKLVLRRSKSFEKIVMADYILASIKVKHVVPVYRPPTR